MRQLLNNNIRIIALRGNQNTGKTATLTIVYDMLTRIGYETISREDLSNNDFKAVLKDKKGERVTIVTQGDYVIGQSSVKRHIEWAIEQCSERLICACTTGTNKYRIQDYINKYDHVYIDKNIEITPSLRLTINTLDAESIIEHLNNHLNN